MRSRLEGSTEGHIKSGFLTRRFEKTPVAVKTCNRTTNIFYLKVHKTGSSTVTTILWRFLVRHGLRLVPVNRIPYPHNNFEQFIVTMPGQKPTFGNYNIYFDHVIFNETAVKHVMPNSTSYFASVRDPLTHLSSQFAEFALWNYVNYSKTGAIAALMSKPSTAYSIDVRMLAESPQSREFGINPAILQNDTAIEAWLKQIETRFSPVIVMEKFDESLVLLRRRFCWSLEDILYTRQRVRGEPKEIFSDEVRWKHKAFSHADYKLYEYFDAKLEQELNKEVDIRKEISNFKEALSKLSNFCEKVILRIRDNPSVTNHILTEYDNKITFEKSTWNDETFTLHAIDCAVMRLDTTVMHNSLITRQIPELCTEKWIQRMYMNHMYFHIGFSRGRLLIHRAYCKEHLLKYGVPLEVLTNKNSYMWLNKNMFTQHRSAVIKPVILRMRRQTQKLRWNIPFMNITDDKSGFLQQLDVVLWCLY